MKPIIHTLKNFEERNGITVGTFLEIDEYGQGYIKKRPDEELFEFDGIDAFSELKEITDLMRLYNSKHEDSLTLILHSDESGYMVEQTDETLFDFTNIDELIMVLKSKNSQPVEKKKDFIDKKEDDSMDLKKILEEKSVLTENRKYLVKIEFGISGDFPKHKDSKKKYEKWIRAQVDEEISNITSFTITDPENDEDEAIEIDIDTDNIKIDLHETE